MAEDDVLYQMESFNFNAQFKVELIIENDDSSDENQICKKDDLGSTLHENNAQSIEEVYNTTELPVMNDSRETSRQTHATGQDKYPKKSNIPEYKQLVVEKNDDSFNLKRKADNITQTKTKHVKINNIENHNINSSGFNFHAETNVTNINTRNENGVNNEPNGDCLCISKFMLTIVRAYYYCERFWGTVSKEDICSRYYKFKTDCFKKIHSIINKILIPAEHDASFKNNFVKNTTKLAQRNKLPCSSWDIQSLLLEMISWAKMENSRISQISQTIEKSHFNPNSVLMQQHRKQAIPQQPIRIPTDLKSVHSYNNFSPLLKENNVRTYPPNQTCWTNNQHVLERQLTQPHKRMNNLATNRNIPEDNRLTEDSNNKCIFSIGTPGQEISISVDSDIINRYNMKTKPTSSANHATNRLSYQYKPPPPYPRANFSRDSFRNNEIMNSYPNLSTYDYHQPQISGGNNHLYQYNNQSQSQEGSSYLPNIEQSQPYVQSNFMQHEFSTFETNGTENTLPAQERPNSINLPCLADQHNVRNSTRCTVVSRDSGFSSPTLTNNNNYTPAVIDFEAEENEIGGLQPIITHVTSLNSNVMNNVEGACHICGKITRNKCLRCYTKYYCSTGCQQLDWPVHEPICSSSVMRTPPQNT